MSDETRNLSGVILAAGYGERMLPLTTKIPKALLPVLGTPLLEILVEKLMRTGAGEIHCNLFHLHARIERFAEGKEWPLRFHIEKELLGTGGGIGNMADDLASARAVLLHNGDVLSNVPYESAIALHDERRSLVTLVLVPSGPAANVAVNDRGEVTAIGAGTLKSSSGERLLGYTGMAVLSPEALSLFPRGQKAALVPILREMIRTRPGSVLGWNAAEDLASWAWGEVGSPAGYLALHRAILIERFRFDPVIEVPPFPFHAGEGAVIDPGARWAGFCEIGRRAVVEREARLENCVVLDDTVVPRGSVHSNEILFPGGTLGGTGGA